VGVIKGLDSQSIPGKKQSPTPLVPHGKCEHAIYAFEPIETFEICEREQHFRIGVSGEPIIGEKAVSQIREVISFTVVNDDPSIALITHRLVTTTQIDDRKSAMCETYISG
jgi:hypothetical protein